MKLARYGNPRAEKPAIVDLQGRLRDLSNIVADLTPDNLSRDALRKIAAVDPSTLPPVTGEPRCGVPVGGVGKFVAIELNYADHAAEANLPLPAEPIVFMKAITSLSWPNDDVVLPKGSLKSDWEIEVGIVIGTRASYVERDTALDHVAGYCIVNDVNEREYQMDRGADSQRCIYPCYRFKPTSPSIIRVSAYHRSAISNYKHHFVGGSIKQACCAMR